MRAAVNPAGERQAFHRGEPLTDAVWEKLMMGLSTRNYGKPLREFTEAYGLEKSTVSERFIEVSRQKLMERRLDQEEWCALLIDATPLAGQQMVAALATSNSGQKRYWGPGGEQRRMLR